MFFFCFILGFIVSASDDMSKSSTLHLIEEPTNKQGENENEQQNK